MQEVRGARNAKVVGKQKPSNAEVPGQEATLDEVLQAAKVQRRDAVERYNGEWRALDSEANKF
eukprot:1214244-Rhodomonas_salina.1